MTKVAGSGSVSQRLGSANPDPNPDPHQNVIDPQHCFAIIEDSFEVYTHCGC
jgi:hypothetical protein